jgi:hypothetical protein
MPADVAIVIWGIVAVFIVFALVLAWGDRVSRQAAVVTYVASSVAATFPPMRVSF